MSRTLSYCFTLNNPTEEEVAQVELIPCKYMVYGREIGECGTPHLQGYVHYRNAKSLKAAKNDLPRAHLEVRRAR